MQKTFVRGARQQKRAFSPEVVIAGLARTIYVAGHTGAKTDDGRSLAGDFEHGAGRPSPMSGRRWPMRLKSSAIWSL